MTGFRKRVKSDNGKRRRWNRRMRWPFRTDRSTDLRVYRDPKTDELKLAMNGEMEFSILKIGVTVQADLPKETALSLRDQVNALFPGE
jgi:hypothetical protein